MSHRMQNILALVSIAAAFALNALIPAPGPAPVTVAQASR